MAGPFILHTNYCWGKLAPQTTTAEAVLKGFTIAGFKYNTVENMTNVRILQVVIISEVVATLFLIIFGSVVAAGHINSISNYVGFGLLAGAGAIILGYISYAVRECIERSECWNSDEP